MRQFKKFYLTKLKMANNISYNIQKYFINFENEHNLDLKITLKKMLNCVFFFLKIRIQQNYKNFTTNFLKF